MFSISRMFPSALDSSPSDERTLPSRRVSSRSIPPKIPSSVAFRGTVTVILPPIPDADLARTVLPEPFGPHISTDEMSGEDRAHLRAPLGLSFPTIAENGKGITPSRTCS